MPATVTLASTTLALVVQPKDRQVTLASTSGVLPGLRLYIGGELMTVVKLGLGSAVEVFRGTDGTRASMHDSGGTVYIGRADQFYRSDPVGSPDEVILVSPHINVTNDSIWFAQGDSLPDPEARRFWQKQSVTYSIGPLGARVEERSPTSST